MQTAKTAPKTFSVYYRTGGTANAKWHIMNERYSTQEEAQGQVKELGKAGYKALYEDSAKLEAMGLPEGYEA